MEQEKDSRPSRIASRLERSGYSLEPSDKEGIWTVKRDGKSICLANDEKLIWDDNN